MANSLHTRVCRVGDILIGNQNPLVLIAGPCIVETPELTLQIALEIQAVCSKLNIPFIFKASFDKANRSSNRSFRGNGLEYGLQVLSDIRQKTGLPVLTDIHESWQAEVAAQVVDVLQIPAFLCRQTDLLVAAAKTGKPVNVKKGQFLAPWDMKGVAEKLMLSGCENILLTERGTSFGYNTLVVDFRGLPQMQALGFPVVFDATHSVQQPGGLGDRSGGQREFVPILAAAAAAVGMDALFLEVHPDPDNAPSDGPNMLKIPNLEPLLTKILRLHTATNIE
ncbi:MAG: 3-deoxy-8-phosphooctulonate synthase [Bacteroidia bacterium]|nr:3-deoxy-8-phosphooctulonate synthase [Bacteroidia bacterium]